MNFFRGHVEIPRKIVALARSRTRKERCNRHAMLHA